MYLKRSGKNSSIDMEDIEENGSEIETGETEETEYNRKDFVKEPITAKDIEEDEGLEKDIIGLIQRMWMESSSFVSRKKSIFKDYDERTKKMTKKGIIKPQVLFQMKKTFIAMFKNEGISPVFKGRNYWDGDIADKLNEIATYDQEVMRKTVKDKEMLEDIFDYGVGLRIYDSYDYENNVPTWKVIDPMCWYPDPLGNCIDDNFRYHMFVTCTTIGELEQANIDAEREIYFDLDDCQPGGTRDNDYNTYKASLRGLSRNDFYNGELYVWNIYLTLNGRKYYCVCANNRDKIIRWEEIEPISKEEKKNPSKVPFQVVVENAFPLADDPFGISYRELVIDKDEAMTRMMNAMYFKELRNAGNDNYIVDVGILPNLHLLAQRAEYGPNFIPAKTPANKSITQAVAPVTDVQNTNNTENFFAFVNQTAQQDTGLTNVVRGVGGNAGTATEAEIQIEKSDLNFSLDSDMLGAGERKFWKDIYLRELVRNIKEIKEKAVALTGSSDALVKIESKEFIGGTNVNVEVVSRKKLYEQNKEQLQQLMSMFPLLQNNPNIPWISLKVYLREMYKKAGFDKRFVETVFQVDASERHSIMMQKLINYGGKPKSLFKPGVDLQTLWYYINQCIENDVKQEVLIVLNQAMIEEGLAKPQQMQGNEMQGVANAMSSQLLSQQQQGFTQ